MPKARLGNIAYRGQKTGEVGKPRLPILRGNRAEVRKPRLPILRGNRAEVRKPRLPILRGNHANGGGVRHGDLT